MKAVREPTTAAPRRTDPARRGRGVAVLQARFWAPGQVGDLPAAAAAAPGGGGAPLAPPLRGAMESAFGTDFGGVRVHQGAHVSRLGAQAFTRGDEIHFAPGRFEPSQAAGRELLAHELVHVVQQRAGRVAAPQPKGEPGGAVVNADPGLEAEADQLGARAARGEAVRVPGSAMASAPRQAPLQLKGEYRALLPAQQQEVKKDALAEYATKAEAFELGMPAVINAQPVVTSTVDTMLAKVRRIFEAWAKSTGQTGTFGGIQDAAYEKAFKFAPADKYFGAFHMNAGAIKRVFSESDQPLRKKLKVVYNAVRNNNLSLWLKLAAADLKEQRDAALAHRAAQAVTYDTRDDAGIEPDPMDPSKRRYKASGWRQQRVKSGFAARSGLDAVLTASGDKEFTDIHGHVQREGIRSAPDVQSSVMAWAADTATTHADRTGGKNAGKALASQPTLKIGDVPDLTADEIRQIRVDSGLPTEKVKRSVKRAFKARPDDKLLWEQGGEYYSVVVGSQLEKDAQAIHARLVAGVSGSTDLMLHAAQHLGMGAQLPALRLVMLGWMLLNRDHSFYEIMRAANSYGVPFHTDAARIGAEYEDPRNFTPMNPTLLQNVLPEHVFPGWFVGDTRLDERARHKYPQDTLVYGGIPRYVLERLQPAQIGLLHELGDAVAAAPFNPAQPVLNSTSINQLRGAAPYLALRGVMGDSSLDLALACLVRHQHGAAVLDATGRAQVAAADVLASHADATARGGHAKQMGKVELDALARPTGTGADYFQVANAKARLRQNADPIKLLKKLLEHKDQAAQRKLTRDKLIQALQDANPSAKPEDFSGYATMSDMEVINLLLTDSAAALAALPKELADKLAAYNALHDKELGAIFKYTTVQFIPIIESLCSHNAAQFDIARLNGVAVDWGAGWGNLHYTAPMIKALSSGLAKMPVYTRPPVFRGMESKSGLKAMDPPARQHWAATRGYTVGAVFTQPYPMSTSKTIEACFFSTKDGFDLGWQIDTVKSGHDIEMLSNSPEEAEVLFEPGSRLRIKNIIYDHARGLLIVADEV